MPRIRTIKPEFWSDEKLATVSESSLLVAIGLLNLADDEGYFNANPKLIDAFIFPLRESSLNTHGAITELSSIGYIDVYKCVKNEKDIGLIKNFANHQVISRPTASKLAPIVDFNNHSLNTHGVIMEDSLTERKGKEQGKEGERKGMEVESVKKNLHVESSQDIFKYWAQVMGKSDNVKFTSERKKSVIARLKSGYSPREISLAIDNCARSEWHMGKNDEGKIWDDLTLICRNDTKLEEFRDRVTVNKSDMKMAKHNQDIEEFSNGSNY